MVLNIICAWCKVTIASGDPGAETSHGMCESCLKKLCDPAGEKSERKIR